MTIASEPVIGAPITPILDDLATCLCAQILSDGLPEPCFCGVIPGALVALDYAGDCDNRCGMAWVRLVSSYPSTSIGLPSVRPGNCSTGIGLDVEVGITRCIEVGDLGEPPTRLALQESTILQQADMMAMWRAVACCRQSKDWVIGTYSPYGPEGGIVGGTLSLSILLT